MKSVDEIASDLRIEVAKCKGVRPEEIDLMSPVMEVIHLQGDDFMAICELIHHRYNSRPSRSDYFTGMNIMDWAKIISAS